MTQLTTRTTAALTQAIELAQQELSNLNNVVNSGADVENTARHLLAVQSEVYKLRDLHIYLGYLSGVRQVKLATIYSLSEGRVSQIITAMKNHLTP